MRLRVSHNDLLPDNLIAKQKPKFNNLGFFIRSINPYKLKKNKNGQHLF